MPIPDHDLYGDAAPHDEGLHLSGSRLFQIDLPGFSGVFQVDSLGRVVYVPVGMAWLRGMRWEDLLARFEFQGARVTELT